MVQFWNNADELNGKVAVSLMKTIKMYPAIGWVRANLQSNTELLQEINTLRKEIEKLQSENKLAEKNTNKKVQNLADLDETILIEGNVLEKQRNGNYINIDSWVSSFTWSEIFVSIAPWFLKYRTDIYARDIIGDILYKLRFNEIDYYGELTEYSFNIIKIQLMALGLMDISERSDICWKLSEKGIQMMLELGSIKTTKK